MPEPSAARDAPRSRRDRPAKAPLSQDAIVDAAMALIERIVPPAKLTEGLTWLVTGLSIGVAVGAAGSGWLVDAHGARSGFWLAIAAGAVVLGSAVQSYRHLK